MLNHINIGRRVQGFDGRPDLFPGMERPRKALGHPNIYFDTLVHDPISFEVMLRRQKSTDQILMGLDDPYPLGEMESEKQNSYPGKLLDIVLEDGLIDATQHAQIWKDNVARWLCGADAKEFIQKISP
jgi:aminocarboxymuconate-semialdehyde decarboxylase